METIFFLPFLGTPATASFIFSSGGNTFLNAFRLVERDFLTSGNIFFIYFSAIPASDLCRYQTFISVSFSSSGNVVLKQILHSGQWELIFWLVETILFQYLKYPFHWKQFFLSLENIFQTNPLLLPVATDFLFSGNDILSFRFF